MTVHIRGPQSTVTVYVQDTSARSGEQTTPTVPQDDAVPTPTPITLYKKNASSAKYHTSVECCALRDVTPLEVNFARFEDIPYGKVCQRKMCTKQVLVGS